jgi:hypothetical protein
MLVSFVRARPKELTVASSAERDSGHPNRASLQVVPGEPKAPQLRRTAPGPIRSEEVRAKDGGLSTS